MQQFISSSIIMNATIRKAFFSFISHNNFLEFRNVSLAHTSHKHTSYCTLEAYKMSHIHTTNVFNDCYRGLNSSASSLLTYLQHANYLHFVEEYERGERGEEVLLKDGWCGEDDVLDVLYTIRLVDLLPQL